MSWIWPILAILVVAMWVIAVIDIVRRRHERSAGRTVAWVIAVLVFPVVGTIAYFLANGAGGSSAAPRDPEMGGRPL
jgi:hypothetical protein